MGILIFFEIGVNTLFGATQRSAIAGTPNEAILSASALSGLMPQTIFYDGDNCWSSLEIRLAFHLLMGDIFLQRFSMIRDMRVM
jgi:hypothetical protein